MIGMTVRLSEKSWEKFKFKDMFLSINVSKERTNFTLKEKNKVIAKSSLANNSDLSKNFLPALDKFLKKHKIEVRNLKKIELKINPKVGLVTSRIVKAIVKTIDWANDL